MTADFNERLAKGVLATAEDNIVDLNETKVMYAAHAVWRSMTSAEKDTLRAVVQKGPLWVGDLPAKDAAELLQELGAAVRVTVKGEQGYIAATYFGHSLFTYAERNKALL